MGTRERLRRRTGRKRRLRLCRHCAFSFQKKRAFTSTNCESGDQFRAILLRSRHTSEAYLGLGPARIQRWWNRTSTAGGRGLLTSSQVSHVGPGENRSSPLAKQKVYSRTGLSRGSKKTSPARLKERATA